MLIIIPKAQLDAAQPCTPRYYTSSPEWDEAQEALVYTDWDATVTRLMSRHFGRFFLGWLVERRLVPMTPSDLKAALKARGGGP
jgi:hypothetical protein